jgi:cobaltochelatase CobS
MTKKTITKTKVKKITKRIKNPALEILGQNEALKAIEIASDNNLSMLLIGETGTGKTTMIKSVADELGKTCLRFSINGETTVDEFVGRWTLKGGNTVYQDGILIEAMRKGWWIVVDELNSALPEILFTLHPLLDDDKYIILTNKDNEKVVPHKDFRFFASINPSGEYAGTKDMNKAFMSRFQMVLNIEYPSVAMERKIVKLKGSVDEWLASLMVDTSKAIRQVKEKEELYYSCSTRDLIQWGLLTKWFKLEDAFSMAILYKAEKEERSLIWKIFRDACGKYEKTKGKIRSEWMIEVDKKDTLSIIDELQSIFESYKKDMEKLKDKKIGEFNDKITLKKINIKEK